MTLPSAPVIVTSRPSGAAPCETQGSISTPSRLTPTAPLSTTLSPKNERALAGRACGRWPSPPSTGTAGACSPSNSSTASVGNEYGSEQHQHPARRDDAPASPTRRSARDSSSVSVAWKGVAAPAPSNAAAQTASAVPDSSSRPEPSTPPAPHPISAAGASAAWMPSSIASGATRCEPLANTTARSAGAPPRPNDRRVRRLGPGLERVVLGRDPPVIRSAALHRSTILRPCRARRSSPFRADRRRQDRRRDRARAPTAGAGRAAGRGVGRRAPGLPGARDADRRRDAAASVHSSSTA